MNSNEYKLRPDDEKNLMLTDAVQEAVSEARNKVKEEFKLNDLKTVYKLRYNKLPRSVRSIINRRYSEDNKGVTFEEAATADPNKWFDLDKYENELMGRIGRTKKQSQQLFGR
jgi:hypothetical protein